MTTFKVGDRVVSLNGKVTGVVTNISPDRMFLRDVKGETLPAGAYPIFEVDDFKLAPPDMDIVDEFLA